MQIDLTPEQQDFVRQAVASGRFERPEDAVQAAMTRWIERERRRAEILAAVDIAKAAIDRGEGHRNHPGLHARMGRGRKTPRPGADCRRATPRGVGASPGTAGAGRARQHLELYRHGKPQCCRG
jgi:Arc/MetJ-type ribon-helix-helix transcriptional regulator